MKLDFTYSGYISVEVRWTKNDCDWLLDLREHPAGAWHHEGLVCTENNKYVWGDLPRYNFGESIEDAKEKLILRCVEKLVGENVELKPLNAQT